MEFPKFMIHDIASASAEKRLLVANNLERPFYDPLPCTCRAIADQERRCRFKIQDTMHAVLEDTQCENHDGT